MYDDPSDFYRGAGKSPREYSSRDVNANFEVYPFRETAGEVVGAFKASLLEDWIDRRFRVSHLVHEPEFSILNVPGADTAVMARFQDAPVGLPHERVRILILSGAHAAVIDIHALNTFCWNQIVPSMQRMFATLRIESTESAPSMKEGPGVEGRALAGLYRSTKSKYVVNLSRPVGFGSHVVALHYYLLTKDGRVHRCYDFPPGRDGTGQDFNFNAALGDDPVNTGTFTVRNKVLYIRMAKDTPENTIEGRVRADGALEIEGCVYLRQ